MEALSLLTLLQTDDEEDSFFDIDFTVPIKRNNVISNKIKKVPKPNNFEDVSIFSLLARTNSSSDSSKRYGNNVVRKYMKLIKPFYNKALRFKFSDEFLATEKKSPLREVCKQLRKSRSASSAVADVAVAERRDDSLLQQHDGIQSAILHCRRSYYSSKDWSRTSMEEEQRRISI